MHTQILVLWTGIMEYSTTQVGAQDKDFGAVSKTYLTEFSFVCGTGYSQVD